ncbi:hypothetical protein Dsin_032011 [Dipteronia sinensis]|uniref:Ribonuclease H1 N-terminal domain-containing protein n=1 Tax=Dipteronia sinensis TaxID=43782 RepID=A0AAD9ZNG6_9ROSI|nr:hypothetical protein Dsin_032011 [Dipteronia sinensis]
MVKALILINAFAQKPLHDGIDGSVLPARLRFAVLKLDAAQRSAEPEVLIQRREFTDKFAVLQNEISQLRETISEQQRQHSLALDTQRVKLMQQASDRETALNFNIQQLCTRLARQSAQCTRRSASPSLSLQTSDEDFVVTHRPPIMHNTCMGHDDLGYPVFSDVPLGPALSLPATAVPLPSEVAQTKRGGISDLISVTAVDKEDSISLESLDTLEIANEAIAPQEQTKGRTYTKTNTQSSIVITNGGFSPIKPSLLKDFPRTDTSVNEEDKSFGHQDLSDLSQTLGYKMSSASYNGDIQRVMPCMSLDSCTMASSSRLTISEASETSLPVAPANVFYCPNSDKDFVLPLISGDESKHRRPVKGTSLNKQEHNLLNHLWAIPQTKTHRQNYQRVLNVYFHYSKKTGKASTAALGTSTGTPNLRPNNAVRSFSHYVAYNGNKYGIYTRWIVVETSIQGMDDPMWEGFHNVKQAQLALHSYRISLDERNSSSNRQTADKKSANLNKQLSNLKKANTAEIAELEHQVAFLKFQLALRDHETSLGDLPFSQALTALPNELRAEIAQITTQTELQRYMFILDFLAEHLRDIPDLQVNMVIHGGKFPYVFPEVTVCFPDFSQVEMACKTFHIKDLLDLGIVAKIIIEGEKIPGDLPQALLDAINENGLQPDHDPIRITCYSTPLNGFKTLMDIPG